MQGFEAEERAAQWLQQRGLSMVCRNWHCRFGEIDLIARDGETLVFVEVRARTHGSFGGAAASITAAKRERLLKAARQYLSALPEEPACRFDAVIFDGADTNQPQWLQNIFD